MSAFPFRAVFLKNNKVKLKMKYNTALPYFPEDDIEFILYEFRKLLAGEGLLSMGKYVREFEQKFAEYIIALSNDTSN